MESDQVLDGFKEMLQSLLSFNPYFRWSPSECLAHPMFDDLRSYEAEESATNKIRLELDSDDAFDYTEGKSHKFTKDDYLNILLGEAKRIHSNRLKEFKKFRWIFISKQKKEHSIKCIELSKIISLTQ